MLVCKGSVGLGGDDGSQPAPCRALGSSTVLYKPCVLIRDLSVAEKKCEVVSFPISESIANSFMQPSL